VGYSKPRPIDSKDDLAAFASGEPVLDDWLRSRAIANQGGGASRCFVSCRDGRVVGYHALATGGIARLEASERAGRAMRYDFEPSPTDPLHLMLLMKDARRIVRGQPDRLIRANEA
jgi:hypothetical protein